MNRSILCVYNIIAMCVQIMMVNGGKLSREKKVSMTSKGGWGYIPLQFRGSLSFSSAPAHPSEPASSGHAWLEALKHTHNDDQNSLY